MLPNTISKEAGTYGKRVIDISQLVDVFEAQEGLLYQIIGKTGNGKTYQATRMALEYLKQGYAVYTTWHLNIPKKYDERKVFSKLFWKTIFFWNKRFYVFDFEKNWHYVDIDRPDLIDYVSNLTDCILFMDEGQDIFDARERADKTTRKSITRTRHLRKSLYVVSQRAQAVDVTLRANITFFYKCVKTWRIYWPFRDFFKVYRTEEMDNQNYPIWEDVQNDWKAELWFKGFARSEIYNAYNSWYLRAGIKKSQEVNFEAYDLNLWEKIKALASFTVFKFERFKKTESYSDKVKKLQGTTDLTDEKIEEELNENFHRTGHFLPEKAKLKPLKEVLEPEVSPLQPKKLGVQFKSEKTSNTKILDRFNEHENFRRKKTTRTQSKTKKVFLEKGTP